uniref:Uncharacterized protein n=1 Tax=Cacopsylla melanoneura TaxID=428564 RepID=A0A8D8ZCF3_9HEMI
MHPSPFQRSVASSSSCSSKAVDDFRPKFESCNAQLYTTPVPIEPPPICPDAGPIPGCQTYEIRCKQTLDGNIAKPGILCSVGENETLYPPMYFGNKTGEYRPQPGRKINLDFDIDLLGCACKNGFCPASRYEQFMAGKGGLPIGHPDANRPDKFHHPFGMGVNPRERDYYRRN